MNNRFTNNTKNNIYKSKNSILTRNTTKSTRTNKTVKQVFYIFLMLSVLVGIGFGIYFLVKYIQKQHADSKSTTTTNGTLTTKAHMLHEVFNISENKFSFNEASDVCKSMDAELATYEQMTEALEKGANWCNYGWIADGPEGRNAREGHAYAFYPIQKDFHDKIQEDESCGLKDQCGKPGMNGGLFDKRAQFGVNCYGLKRDAKEGEHPEFKCQSDIDKEDKIAMLKQSDKMLAPFAADKWSVHH